MQRRTISASQSSDGGDTSGKKRPRGRPKTLKTKQLKDEDSKDSNGKDLEYCANLLFGNSFGFISRTEKYFPKMFTLCVPEPSVKLPILKCTSWVQMNYQIRL